VQAGAKKACRVAGYSGKALIAKLGIKPGMRYLVKHAPDGFFELLGPLPAGVEPATAARGTFDFIHAFYATAAAYERELPALCRALAPAGMLWISWPKGGAKATPPTDVTENVVRDNALATGLVDVKVAAVDERWSGLKLVVRVGERANWPRSIGRNA
jgi:hypothetical protein